MRFPRLRVPLGRALSGSSVLVCVIGLAGCTIHVHAGGPPVYGQLPPDAGMFAPTPQMEVTPVMAPPIVMLPPAVMPPPAYAQPSAGSAPPSRPPLRDLGARLRPPVAVPAEFTETFGGGGGIRFRIRNVSIDGVGNVVERRRGGPVWVRMDLLHDCSECGNAVNQVIVGLAGEERAQASVWNGKQRSGGPLVRVNAGSARQALAEDNPGPATWVTVRFQVTIPDQPGVWYLRARYAQDYQGNLFTDAARHIPQPTYDAPLRWWKVDRPQGPDARANIGAVIVR